MPVEWWCTECGGMGYFDAWSYATSSHYTVDCEACSGSGRREDQEQRQCVELEEPDPPEGDWRLALDRYERRIYGD